MLASQTKTTADHYCTVRLSNYYLDSNTMTELRSKNLILVAGVTTVVSVGLLMSWLLSTKNKKLKLYYFNIPGKGEPIRLACAYSGIDFEDVRVDREQFEKLKQESKLPFGQLPVLQVSEDTFLSQSAAIMRYIGKLGGLYPKDPIAAALVDAVMDEEHDLFAGISIVRYKGTM